MIVCIIIIVYCCCVEGSDVIDLMSTLLIFGISSLIDLEEDFSIDHLHSDCQTMVLF